MNGLVIFRDEHGNEGQYTFHDDATGDKWVQLCERAQARLGITETREQKLRWPHVRQAAAQRAPKIGDAR